MFRTVVLACFFLINATPALAATNTPPVIPERRRPAWLQATAYTFRPIATDADGNSLRFKIVRNPPGPSSTQRPVGSGARRQQPTSVPTVA